MKNQRTKSAKLTLKNVTYQNYRRLCLDGIHGRVMNKNENIKVKIRKYPSASSIDISDHIKPSLQRAPEQIITHAGANDISNHTSYLKNVKKLWNWWKKPVKIPNLAFPQWFFTPILKVLVILSTSQILT